MDELHIKVPAAFDIDVLTSRSEFTSVTDLESTTASIKAQDGDIFVKNIKSGDIKLIANRGGISCKKLLQGNILINAASKIRTDRLQGPIIELKSDSDIHTQDVYAEEVTITSKETVGIKSIHGKSKVFSEESDVIIGTVEGESEVQAENGTANL
uniref:Adhesin domain-containing protein n=1 Tax=Ciona savignyi TaxID=51511 RepID=H2Y7K0_CIOSA